MVHNPPHTASSPSHTGDPCPHLCNLNPPTRDWSPLEGLGTQETHQPPTPSDRQLAPSLAGFGLASSSHIHSSCYSVRHMSGIRGKHTSAGLEIYLSEETVKTDKLMPKSLCILIEKQIQPHSEFTCQTPF